MRFGFNDQQGHTRAAEVVRDWTTGARVPVPVDVEMWSIDHYMYVLSDKARVIFTLYTEDPTPSADLFAAKAAAITDRHPRAIIAVFNEPNNPAHGPVDPARVRSVVNRVRLALPASRKVIGPALSPTGEWEDYFRAVYPLNNVAPALNLYPRKADWAADVDAQIALAKANRGGSGSWHVTEVGVQHEYYGASQAEITRKLYKKIANKGAADCIFHSLTRLPGDWEARQRLWAVEDDNSLSTIGRALKAERT